MVIGSGVGRSGPFLDCWKLSRSRLLVAVVVGAGAVVGCRHGRSISAPACSEIDMLRL